MPLPIARISEPATLPAAAPSGVHPNVWSWRESLLLVGVAAAVALGLAHHEPWADEAQAWLMARDMGWWRLIAHGVRYEGTPGLWQSLLWLMARLHIGYLGMHWVAGAFAVAGGFVLLRSAPFPRLLRCLLPFGFWLVYQDAVVARSYVLFAVLAFSAAALLRARRDRALALAAILGLMANLSSQAFIASVGFALAAWAGRGAFRRHRAVAVLLLVLFWVGAVASAWPPADVDFQAGENVEHSVLKIEAALGSSTARAELQRPALAIDVVLPGELVPTLAPVHHRSGVQSFWNRIARLLSLLTFPLTTFRWFGLLVCGLVIATALSVAPGSRGVALAGLAPWLLMVLVFTFMYCAPRHAGMLYVAFVSALWLTWPARRPASRRVARLVQITLLALVLVAVQQIAWTLHAIRADWTSLYSGDAAAAEFLRSHAEGRTVAGFYFHSIGPLAWFDHNLYDNLPHSYWVWSRDERSVQRAPFTLATGPDFVVMGGWSRLPHDGEITDDWLTPEASDMAAPAYGDVYHVLPYALAHGYREAGRFCGRSIMRDRYAQQLCQIILEKNGRP